MFNDYVFLCELLRRMENKWTGQRPKNELHRALESLLEQGEHLRCQRKCPFCRQFHVSRFLVIYIADGDDFALDPDSVCCVSRDCARQLIERAEGKHGELKPIRFSTIAEFGHPVDQWRVGKFLRLLFDLPERLTAEQAQDFFDQPDIFDPLAGRKLQDWIVLHCRG